ncbi:major facilitator superfamily domain-containing protein [Boletus coccyginus]|nr:major facilitator superfamily domain-containing protein [Boletus coccyginus]
MVRLDVSHWCPTSHDIKDLSESKEKESTQDERVALDRTVWRKLDRWILPLCVGFILLSSLDQNIIGHAHVAGLQRSLAMSNNQYAMVLTVTYAPLIASQLPSTLFLKYVGPDLMLPAIITFWGVVTASQGFVTNYSGLLACQLLSGLGGGLLSGTVLYVSSFYPRKQMQVRITAFFVAETLPGSLSGLLAAAIQQLNGKGGKPGWAWIFILEGLITFVFGVISFFLLPRSPETARFLTEKERVYVVSALKHAGSVADDDDKDNFRWVEVVRSMKSPHVWLLAIAAFFSGTITIGLSRFTPTIVSELGYAGSQAQLMSAPPSAASFVLCFISAFISDRYQCRGYAVIFFSLLKTIGFTMFYASTSHRIRYASLFFSTTGAICAVPAMVTWLTNNSAPHTRRAAAVAVCTGMNQVGGILGTWLLGSLSPAPNYTSATITFITMSVGIVILSVANLVHLSWQTRLKAERRQKMRKEEEPDGLGDRSAWFVYSL